MQTRTGLCYPRNETDQQESSVVVVVGGKKRRRTVVDVRVVGIEEIKRKKRSTTENKKRSRSPAGEEDRKRTRRIRLNFFDGLPDDLVLLILSRLSSSATTPSDVVSALLTCKRLNVLGLNPMVLAKASAKALAVKATSWSDSAHRFLKLCADAGNLDACYMLGMIRFYCMGNRGSGASLMARAAIGSHAAALYSLAVIQFNGSGGTKNDKDLRAGVALCARAAFLGHVDALRELGHCLQDGYGVRQNIAEGRRFLLQANARELAAWLSSSSSTTITTATTTTKAVAAAVPSTTAVAAMSNATCPLLSDFGCSIPGQELNPANKFLVDWFKERGIDCGGGNGRGGDVEGLRLCSHSGCGRPETRRHEFRRCSVCGTVNYCSRACQALDWKLSHKASCTPMERWLNNNDPNPDVVAAAGAGDVEGDEQVIENN